MDMTCHGTQQVERAKAKGAWKLRTPNTRAWLCSCQHLKHHHIFPDSYLLFLHNRKICKSTSTVLNGQRFEGVTASARKVGDCLK